MQARGLIYDFLMARDLDRALMVTNMLPPSTDCATVDDGRRSIWLPHTPGPAGAVLPIRSSLQRRTASGRCPTGAGHFSILPTYRQIDDDVGAIVRRRWRGAVGVVSIIDAVRSEE